jgi:hypothetical protein
MLIAMLVASLAFASAAFAVAAEVEINDEQLIVRLGDKVYAENCNPCHGSIADTDNFAGEIIFRHGYHQLVACSACHSRFPHRPEGTERPTMQGCFDCHGLKHGPMGELARGNCDACHRTPVDKLRPVSHTWDWAKKPHVEPGSKRFQTQCMMCHDEKGCTDCHDNLGIRWDPGVPYTFDSNTGCLSCHGDENLTKTSGGQPKSYQVLGVQQSAHRGLTCQQCHKDYRYEDDAVDPTPLWNVNAGLACRDCHANPAMFTEDQAARNATVIEEYDNSTHAEALSDWMVGTLRTPDRRSNTTQPPTCADCHGGHYIQKLDTDLARQVMHGSAYRVCARCHQEEYDSYDDYYHGAAYKRGASDSPACWECHGSHDILPSSNPDSMVSSQNLAATCGIEGCHSGSDEAFVVRAGDLIHRKVEAADANPLRRVLSRIRSWFS